MKRTTFLKSLLALSVIPFIPLKGKEEKDKYWAKDGKGGYKSSDTPPVGDGITGWRKHLTKAEPRLTWFYFLKPLRLELVKGKKANVQTENIKNLKMHYESMFKTELRYRTIEYGSYIVWEV